MDSPKNLLDTLRVELASDDDVSCVQSHVAECGGILKFGTILGQCIVDDHSPEYFWSRQGIESAAYSLERPKRLRIDAA